MPSLMRPVFFSRVPVIAMLASLQTQQPIDLRLIRLVSEITIQMVEKHCEIWSITRLSSA